MNSYVLYFIATLVIAVWFYLTALRMAFNKKSKWYDWIFLLPELVIIYIFKKVDKR